MRFTSVRHSLTALVNLHTGFYQSPVVDLRMLKEEEIYPVDTVVRFKKTGVFAIIKNHAYQSGAYGFQHYLGIIEGKEGLYCIMPYDIELECLPGKQIYLDTTRK